MQIPAAHEARLRWVRVDPSKDHRIFLGINIIEERGFVDHLARIACVLLLWDDDLLDENCVGDHGPAQHAAGFEVPSRV